MRLAQKGLEQVKKWIIALAVLLLLGSGAAAYVGYAHVQARRAEEAAAALAEAVRQAETAQQAVHRQYEQLNRQAEESRLIVTENGVQIGEYTLSELGLQEKLTEAIAAQFSDTDRMADFAALEAQQKLDWHAVPRTTVDSVPLDAAALDLHCVLEDLAQQPREAAVNASVCFVDGVYQIQPETAGTELREDVVAQHLADVFRETQLTADAPLRLRCEITDTDCYAQPEITAEHNDFDWAQQLAEDTAGLQIPVQFHGQTELLEAAPLLGVDATGVLQVDSAALTEQIARWAEKYHEIGVPYRFQSYVGGEVDIPFLFCNYALDTQQLQTTLEAQLRQLDSAAVAAPMLCTDGWGEPFAIGSTYVEVDIPNQRMTYFKDGELITSTDVVTGRPWGYTTPTGLYEVWDKATDCWLVGADYCVFVKYWVAFYDVYYGLHDAEWRDVFGGEEYIYNGSHGCVNTPDDPMKLIYDTIELGTPVLIF